MKTLSSLFVLIALLGVVACAGQSSAGYTPEYIPVSSDRIILTNGIVLDGRGSEPIRDGIVVIDKDRIAFVGKPVDFHQPADALVMDVQGGTILPGIIDAHVHSASDPVHRRKSLVNGVTSICDLGSTLENMPQFEEKYLEKGPVARGFHSGPIITAKGGLPDAVLNIDYNYEVGTPGEARAAVIDLHNRGADVIKVYLQSEAGETSYPMIDEQELAAIVDEAHDLGLLVRAHVTYASLLGMAVQAGVDTIEHVPVNQTQIESQSISESQLQALFGSEDNDPLQVYFSKLNSQYEAQLEAMAAAGIVLVPTLDRPLRELYGYSNPTPKQQIVIEIIQGIVRRFHESGGEVALGTDYNINADKQSGMPMGEMEMLLAAGLTPMEVIEAGTRVSADVCGHGDELGTLEPGKLADVIVVDGNPLADLQAMDQVILVIKNGEIAVLSEEMLNSANPPTIY